MSWIRRLWYALAVVGLLASVAVLLGAVYGQPDVSVDRVETSTETIANTTGGNCPEQVVRTVDVHVTVSRDGFEPSNPQWWKVAIEVRATVFDSARGRSVTLAPSETKTVTLPFTSAQDRSWAPREFADVVVQVTRTNRRLTQTTRTVTMEAVASNRSCR